MRTAREPFTWSEDVDETLNFWFWLRRKGELAGADLTPRVQEWAGLHPYAGHSAAAGHPRFGEYLRVGRDWKNNEVQRHIESLRSERPRAFRARYKAMKAAGVRIRVQWVMASFDERWLIPPDLAVMGVEGSTADERSTAVLEAALALR